MSGRITYTRSWIGGVIVTTVTTLGVIARYSSTRELLTNCWLAAAIVPFVTFPVLILCISHIIMVAIVILYVKVSSDVIILILIVGS